MASLMHATGAVADSGILGSTRMRSGEFVGWPRECCALILSQGGRYPPDDRLLLSNLPTTAGVLFRGNSIATAWAIFLHFVLLARRSSVV